MLKRSLLCLLSLAASLALGAAPLVAQDAASTDAPKESAPADLSLDGLMVEPPKEAEPLKIDEALLTPPENASVDELFEFVESLQDKLPKPKSQEELRVVVDAFSKACLQVANKLFAMEMTPEQRNRAVQLKVVALTTRANIDDQAADELDAFVDENLKAAKTDEELVKAYQLKLQVLASAEEGALDKINALADEMFKLDKEDLQVFAIEVKAQAFLSQVQRTGELNEDVLKFVDDVVADENRAVAVKEKALEMKLVALVIASELEKDKDATEQNKTYAEEAEKLFETLMTGEYSADLRKMVYQLRVQTLLDPNATDEKATEKLETLVERLAKEEDKELYALGVAVKGQLLLNAAQKNKDDVGALEEYADSVYAQSKEKEELRNQAIGLKIQSYRLKEDSEALLKFVDDELAQSKDETVVPKLKQIKISVITDIVNKDPESFDKYADFIAELSKDEANAEAVSNLYAARFVGAVSKIAEGDGKLDAFNSAVEQLKKDVLASPNCIVGLLMARANIVDIGKKNNNDALFDETFKNILDFCKVADNDEVNALAQQLEAYQKQMEQLQKQAEAQAAEKSDAEDADQEKNVQDAPETK